MHTYQDSINSDQLEIYLGYEILMLEGLQD